MKKKLSGNFRFGMQSNKHKLDWIFFVYKFLNNQRNFIGLLWYDKCFLNLAYKFTFIVIN